MCVCVEGEGEGGKGREQVWELNCVMVWMVKVCDAAGGSTKLGQCLGCI